VTREKSYIKIIQNNTGQDVVMKMSSKLFVILGFDWEFGGGEGKGRL